MPVIAYDAIKFSLITATVDRVEPFRRLLRTLDLQNYRQFELIVVDQNADDRLVPELSPYLSRFPVLHLRSPRGVSRARNRGLKEITGDVVGFPDDDCWYAPNHLENLVHWFQKHPDWHGVSGCTVNEEGRIVLGQFDAHEGELSPFNIWRRVNANTLFLRRQLVEKTGGFDEELGVGASTPWQSAEDVDYPLRAIKNGFRILYRPELHIFHPSVDDLENNARMKRAYKYSLGTGRAIRKHQYPLWFLAYNWIGPCKPMLLSLLRGRLNDARFFAVLSIGRFRGWTGWA